MNREKYCSQKCYWGERVKIVCKQCKKIFYEKQSRKHAIFCSYKCAGKDKVGKRGNHTGYKHTEETKRKISRNRKGKMLGSSHFAFKGKYIGTHGYVWIYKPDHPSTTVRKYVREHRLVAEEYIKRFLKPQERPHHINGNKADNRPENLFIFDSIQSHQAFHRLLRKNPTIKLTSNLNSYK